MRVNHALIPFGLVPVGHFGRRALGARLMDALFDPAETDIPGTGDKHFSCRAVMDRDEREKATSGGFAELTSGGQHKALVLLEAHAEEVAKCGRFEQTTRADCDRLRVHLMPKRRSNASKARLLSNPKGLRHCGVLEQRPEGENSAEEKAGISA